MGATVTTARMVAAFHAPSGKVIYVLFEKTYEKNVTPHIPHWSCVGFGTLDQVLKRIFEYGSSCEGGSLQNPSGRFTPEGYIRTWMRELAAPLEMPNERVVLNIGEHYSYALHDTGQEATVFAAFNATPLLEEIRVKRHAVVNLHEEIELLMALHHDADVSSWRLVTIVPWNADRNANLGYNPAPAKNVPLSRPHVLRLDGEERIVLQRDGKWKPGGWAYSVVGDFIQHLWKTELRSPGSYTKLIRAYRETVKAAPMINPSEFRIEINIDGPLQKWEQRQIDKITDTCPHRYSSTGLVLEVPTSLEALHDLAYSLPASRTRWVQISSDAQLSGAA